MRFDTSLVDFGPSLPDRLRAVPKSRVGVLALGRSILRESETATIYCATVPSGAIKIGRTTDRWRVRLGALQTGHHEEILLAYSFSVTPLMADIVERDIHQHLADKRIRGEWFDVSESDAIEACDASYAEYESLWRGLFMANVGYVPTFEPGLLQTF